MKCKFCQAEMPDDAPFCPYCGKNNAEEVQEVEAVEELAETVEEVLEEEGEAVVTVETDAPETEEPIEEEETVSPKLKRMKLFAALSGCLAVLAVLGTVLFFGIKGSFSEDGKGWDVASWFAWMKPRENSLTGNESYTVSDKKAAKKRGDVVATVPGGELTNGELQVYYWMQVIEFINEYGYYLSYVGLDYTQPLDEQASMESGQTWQQYFLQGALEMWQSNKALALMAQEAGFELDAEYREYLDGLQATMDSTAQQNGFADADAMLKEELGAGCTMEDYQAYMETYYTAYLYYGELYDALNPTDADIEKFFEDNQTTFEEQGITKESGKYYTIRHIQINVEGGIEDEEGNITYTDEDWMHCKNEAQKILDTWLAGEMTEESFTELVADNSDDSNSKDYGGEYSGFTKGDLTSTYGENLDNWCADESRQTGDCELVQSTKGYHLIFFVSSEDIWYAEAEAGLMDELGGNLVKEALESHPMEIDYTKIILGEVELG